MYKQMKNWVKERSLKRRMQVIKTGCTDHCKRGPVVAVMPKNHWHFEVVDEKAFRLFEELAAKL